MNNTRNNFPDELLGTILQVDAPPFLLTRIQQKIANQMKTRFSMRLTWALSFSFILVLTLNIFVLVKSTATSTKKQNLAEIMQLTPDNSPYK